ncbi:MAG: NUDIX domain-containing protein [Prevotellaceae bacterium]|jgi:8-oxo-dGTP pyrophosphatase MutT (NUDIX family)|nr:NUDIX domain-containing protein [Prevotellaceae bacterium]
MTKIFFDDRVFSLSDDAGECFGVMNGLGTNPAGELELAELFDSFELSPQIPEMRALCSDISEALRMLCSRSVLVRAAGGVVRNAEGKILLIHRLGLWDLPKGKSEGDESEADTALREVREECGLHDLHLGKKLRNTYHVYRLDHIRIIKETAWYAMTSTGAELPRPQVEEGIDRVGWASVEDLPKYADMYASIRDLLTSPSIIINQEK